MNATQINSALCDRAEEVVLHLFPCARIKNGEASIGDITGSPGESLKIRVSGAKTGFWSDFAGDLKGKTLIGLWCEARGGDFKKASQEALGFIGASNPSQDTFYRENAAPRSSCPLPNTIPVEFNGPVGQYLQKDRGISLGTLQKYQVGQDLAAEKIYFPSFDDTGKALQAGKFLALKRSEDGKKEIQTIAKQGKYLFGKHAVKRDGEDLFICEGEIDALSMAEMGYPAVSVPFGAKTTAKDDTNPNDEWITNDFDWLECFSKIYLCFDNDKPGQDAARSLVKRLGVERCYLVQMPEGCNDVNDALRQEKSADMFDAVESAKTVDPSELKNASIFREDVWKRLNPEEQGARGIPFIWEIPWRIRICELTIWTGMSGHGKSEIINHLVVHLAALAQKSCIASFEVPARKTLENMTLQSSAQVQFDRTAFDTIFDWLSLHIWIVDRVGRFSWRDLLEIFRYARRRYGITQFVVDSLLRCGIPGDDYEQQKAFVDALVLFAMENDCHVHLVAHSRKKEDEHSAPGKLDVKGSGDITDLAHNVAIIYRNKGKEAEIDKLRVSGQTAPPDLLRKPDGFLHIAKQRETGEEFQERFWFHRGVKQFISANHLSPKIYAK